MRLPGRRILLRTLRWTRSRFTGGTIVLGYHRVSADPLDPFALSAKPAAFAAHIRFIARHAHPIALRELDAVARGGKLPARSVVVTFDDGYADTVATVLPLLEQHGVPATVFVTTGNPGREYWWDELTRLILADRDLPPVLELDVGTRLLVTDARERMGLLLELAALLRPADPYVRDALMDRIRNWAGTPDGTPLHRALTEPEIRSLAASPLVEIGAHSVTHRQLATLPFEEQLREARDSRLYLERISGQSVTSFSYPHGSFSELTRQAVHSAGFERACCSVPDAVTPRSHALALPRLWLDRCDERTFGRWMDRWLMN